MLIIGMAGGSGSGKTTVVKKLIESLPKNSVSLISQDAYYYDNGHLTLEQKKKINFDHPSSIEFELLIKQLDELRAGKTIEMPTYSYVDCARLRDTITIEPKRVIIVEGILIFTNEELRNRMNIKVFVDTDSDNRLMRIISRDMVERGRSLEQVLSHYKTFVRPMHLQFIEPAKRYADIIIPQGGKNHVGIDILAHKIKASL
jgi:uridine kinase